MTEETEEWTSAKLADQLYTGLRASIIGNRATAEALQGAGKAMISIPDEHLDAVLAEVSEVILMKMEEDPDILPRERKAVGTQVEQLLRTVIVSAKSQMAIDNSVKP